MEGCRVEGSDSFLSDRGEWREESRSKRVMKRDGVSCNCNGLTGRHLNILLFFLESSKIEEGEGREEEKEVSGMPRPLPLLAKEST
jgi:hypothetical protein